MRNHTWLKFIEETTTSYGLRELFHKTYGLVSDPETAALFFNRIDFLIARHPTDLTLVGNLEDLREDIEDEIENRTLRKKREAQKLSLFKSQQEEKKEKSQEKIAGIESEYLKNIDFENCMDLAYKVERELFLKTLNAVDQSRTKAAKVLGINARTLRNKLNEYKFSGRSEGSSKTKVAQNSEVL